MLLKLVMLFASNWGYTLEIIITKCIRLSIWALAAGHALSERLLARFPTMLRAARLDCCLETRLTTSSSVCLNSLTAKVHALIASHWPQSCKNEVRHGNVTRCSQTEFTLNSWRSWPWTGNLAQQLWNLPHPWCQTPIDSFLNRSSFSMDSITDPMLL